MNSMTDITELAQLKPGKYAILYRDNWDGEKDEYHTLAVLTEEGGWYDDELNAELLQYQGDKILKVWPLDDGSNILALVEALEKAQTKNELVAGGIAVSEKLHERIAYLEKRLKGTEESLIAATDMVRELESRTVTAAAADVLAERQRQVAAEGWTAERDDSYQNSELADAAACYAIHAHNQGFSTPAHWPWSTTWWKQTNPRRDLVKAGALILAEIERLDRATGIKVETE